MPCAMIDSLSGGTACGLNGVIANGIGVRACRASAHTAALLVQVYGMAMVIAIVIPVI